MATRADFVAARRAIMTSLETKKSLCRPFLDVLPVSGISVSVLATPVGQTTICSSDDTAARLDELQFDLGEGPCWDAMSSRRPVLESEFDGVHNDRWPLFGAAITDRMVRGIYAFPLAIGSLDLGAVDLYSTSARSLSAEEVADATALADVTAWQVLRRIVTDEPEPEVPHSRREVHQATGMVLAQLDISADDAVLLLRAHAFSSGRSMREVSEDVIARRIVFSPDEA